MHQDATIGRAGHPKKGCGRELVNYAESFVRERGYASRSACPKNGPRLLLEVGLCD